MYSFPPGRGADVAKPPWANRAPDIVFDPRTTTPEEMVATMKAYERMVRGEPAQEGDEELLRKHGAHPAAN